jgi:hypothetical protein
VALRGDAHRGASPWEGSEGYEPRHVARGEGSGLWTPAPPLLPGCVAYTDPQCLCALIVLSM